MNARRTLIPLAILLLHLYSRLRGLMALPPFIDEYLHIHWAQDAVSGHLFARAGDGRFLALWWMGLFGLEGGSALWVTRAVTVLFTLIAVATLYNLGTRLVSRWAGTLAALLYILAPFAFFHDRLGLSDAYVSTFGILSLWFAVRYARLNQNWSALASGLCAAAALAVKANGIALVLVPAIAVLCLARGWPRITRGWVLCAAAFSVICVPLFAYFRLRGIAYFGVATNVVGTGSTSGLVERLLGNASGVLQMETAYFSAVALIVALFLAIAFIARTPRTGLMLALVMLLPLGAILLFGTKISGRYVLFHVPFLALLLGRALAAFNRIVGMGMLLVWGLLFALPFQANLIRDPSTAALPLVDRLEYVEADSSGFALREAARFLLEQSSGQSIHVIGLLSNCGGFALEVTSNGLVTVECPLINFNGEEQPRLTALVNQRMAEVSPLWVAVDDDVPYISLNGITGLNAVKTFSRPGNLSHVTLYQEAP